MLTNSVRGTNSSSTNSAAAKTPAVDSSGQHADGGTGSVLVMPNLSGNSAYAVSARQAGRLNAMSVSREEHRKLLDERQTLLDKFLDGSISKKEQNRLAYVRWSLDRIEDAQYGASMDILETQVESFENLIGEIERFNAQLERLSSPRR